jgi:hypothetical protein
MLLSVYAVPHHVARAQTSHNVEGHNVEGHSVEGHNDEVDLRLSRCRSAHTDRPDSVRPPVFKIAYAVVPGPCTTPCLALQLLILMPSFAVSLPEKPNLRLFVGGHRQLETSQLRASTRICDVEHMSSFLGKRASFLHACVSV